MSSRNYWGRYMPYRGHPTTTKVQLAKFTALEASEFHPSMAFGPNLGRRVQGLGLRVQGLGGSV